MKIIQSKCPHCGQTFNVRKFPAGIRNICPKCRKELMLDPESNKKYMKYNYMWVASILLVLILGTVLFPGKYYISLLPVVILAVFGPAWMQQYLAKKDIFHYIVDPTKADWNYDGEGNYYNDEGERVDYLDPRKKYQTIERYMTKELIKDHMPVIDCRSKEEYLAGHIKGSIHMELDHAEVEHREKLSGTNKFYVVYGNTRKESAALCYKLNELGYHHMCDLGELSKWDEPLVAGEESE